MITGETDKLDHATYAENLTEILSDPKTQTPMTVGLFAKWGRGKSSMIELIEEWVDKHNNQIKQAEEKRAKGL